MSYQPTRDLDADDPLPLTRGQKGFLLIDRLLTALVVFVVAAVIIVAALVIVSLCILLLARWAGIVGDGICMIGC